MADFEDDESPFIAPDGSVWHYVFVANPSRSEETIFVVLPKRQTIDYSGVYQTEFRQYFDLLTGELEWFAAGSAMNRRAKAF